MEDLIFEELRYDNVGKEGVLVVYDATNYKITEKHFLIQEETNKKKNKVIYKLLYEYFFEDNNIESISNYILDKYDDEIIYLLFLNISIDKDDSTFKDISNVILDNYILDMEEFSK